MSQILLALFLGAAPAPVAPTAPPAPPSAALAITPETQRAVDRLMVATRPMAQFDAVMPSVVDMILPSFLAGNEDRMVEMRKIFSEEFLASMGQTKPLIEGKIRELYATRLTPGELNAIADFYESPVGRKSLEIAPQLQLEMMKFGQEAGRAAAQDALPRIVERLRKSDFKLPEGI